MKKIISFLILSSFLLNSCSNKEEKIEIVEEQEIKYVQTKVLEEESFSERLKLTGKISSLNETIVSSQVSGIINSVNFNIGDKVEKGDILATIDTQSNLSNINFSNAINSYNNTLDVYNLTKKSIEDDLEAAKMQLENAKTNRDNTYNTTEKQLELAKTQLESVQKQKENTSKTVDSSINLSLETIKNSKLTLENFLKTSEDTLNGLYVKEGNLYNNIRVTITSGLSSLNTSLTFVDETLGVTKNNKDKNDSYDTYLSIKNTTLKKETKDLFKSINLSYLDLSSTYKENLSDEEIESYFDKLQKLVNDTNDLLVYMTNIFDNSITSVDFSSATLSSLKTINSTNKGIIIGLKTSIVNLKGELDNLKTTISSTKNTMDTQKLSLEQAVNIAQSSYDNTVANTNTSLDSIGYSEKSTKTQLESTIASIEASREISDNNLQIAELQYNSAKSKYNSQLASTKSQLDNVGGQKDLANQQLINSSIKAPFSGVIVSKNVEIGALVNPGSQVFLIANDDIKIVKIDVNSDNVKYVQSGMKIEIHKGEKSFTGYISNISLSADNNTKLFKIESNFIEGEDLSSIFLGDFVNIFIDKESNLEKYLIIPFSSLVPSSTGEYSVYLVGSGNIVEGKKIKIGESNSSEIIVKDGLKIGDKVIVKGTLNVGVGDLVSELK